MYLNFSNFRGRTSAGGDKPWSKNGDKCRMGGGELAKFSPDGGPPSPPGKKTLPRTVRLAMALVILEGPGYPTAKKVAGAVVQYM